MKAVVDAADDEERNLDGVHGKHRGDDGGVARTELAVLEGDANQRPRAGDEQDRDGHRDEGGEADPGAEGAAAAGPVADGDHAREVGHDGGGDRAGQQREHHTDEAIGVDQSGDAAGRQHGGHRLIDEQAAGGDHAAEQHRAVLAGDLARGFVHAVPAQAEAVAVRAPSSRRR